MAVYGAKNLTGRGGAYALLALAVREEWGISPPPPLERLPGGKPAFIGWPEHEFNLSHSGPLALCALNGQPVGADIQMVKGWRPGLPARVCAPAELEWLEGREPGAFAAVWAMKEARVKQSGQGLRLGKISDIAVPLPRPGETLLALEGLWFRLYRGEGWAGAVCALTPPPEKILWRNL